MTPPPPPPPPQKKIALRDGLGCGGWGGAGWLWIRVGAGEGGLGRRGLEAGDGYRWVGWRGLEAVELEGERDLGGWGVSLGGGGDMGRRGIGEAR